MKKDGAHTVQLLLNPKSFTQTIENLFYFSFFIEKDDASVKTSEDADVKAIPVVVVTSNHCMHGMQWQSIVSLSWAQWR